MHAIQLAMALRDLSDLGGTLTAHDEGLDIVIRDYAPEGMPETSYIEHAFEASWEYDANDVPIDVVTPLIEKIKAFRAVKPAGV